MRYVRKRLTLLLAGWLIFDVMSAVADGPGPALSADGDQITGLIVDGFVYSIEFRDGSISEIYDDVAFDADREREALAVSDAIARFLGSINASPGSIAGCKGPDYCAIFLPEERWVGPNGEVQLRDSSSIAIPGLSLDPCPPGFLCSFRGWGRGAGIRAPISSSSPLGPPLDFTTARYTRIQFQSAKPIPVGSNWHFLITAVVLAIVGIRAVGKDSSA